MAQTDLVQGYAYPRWLLPIGTVSWLLTIYLAWNSIDGVIGLFSS